MRVVVVGSGIAGLSTALRAAERHEVVLVTKGELDDSSTRWAQGGIAAALFADDSVDAHVADTLRAGAGLADPAAVRVLCAEGADRVRELIALGVPFDRVPTAGGDELARGHEAAHSARRVLHAGGDATGLAIERALLAVLADTRIEVRTRTFLDELVVDPASGAVVGVDVLDRDGRAARIAADAVVLASGGAGRLYRHTTNPAVATGDGIAAAWRAGAPVADLEFVQFHPTALAVPGTPLISEAVRGEGGVLLDADGERFMLALHPDGELAPRDVVARGIARTMAAQDGAPVLLDATGIGRDELARRFPGLTRRCAEAGFDWAAQPIPVTPAAHYLMGGVRTDLDGRTGLAGLLAVGETARTGAHGANRLASNSLLEGLVFGARAAEAIDDPRPSGDAALATARPIVDVVTDGAGELRRDELQSLLWRHAGLERDADGLAAAADALAGASAAPTGDAVADRETRNLIELGRLVVAAALHREESRGAHARTDHPRARADAAVSTGWVRVAEPAARRAAVPA